MKQLDRMWNGFRNQSIWVQIIVFLAIIGVIGTVFLSLVPGFIYIPDRADQRIREAAGRVDDYGSGKIRSERAHTLLVSPTGDFASASKVYCVVMAITPAGRSTENGHFIASYAAASGWTAHHIATQSAWEESGCNNWEAGPPSLTALYIAFVVIAAMGVMMEVRRQKIRAMAAPDRQSEAYSSDIGISDWKSKTILYLILVVASVVALLPFFWMISTSLMSLGETLNKRWLPSNIDMGSCPIWKVDVPLPTNYCEALDAANFEKFFMNSVIISAVSIVGLLVISVLAGYAFARIKFVGRDVIFTLLLATLMIPASVTLIPNFITIRGDTVPLPDFALTGEGIQGSWEAGNSWLNSLYALTVPFMGSPFIIFLLRQFFAQIPDELWDAARIDGAGHLRFLIQICLPISKPAIWTATLLTFIQSWNSFLWPLIVTTEDVWRPIMVGLWNFVSDAGPQTHLLMAGAVITMLPMLVIYFIAQKSFTEGIATSGLKG